MPQDRSSYSHPILPCTIHHSDTDSSYMLSKRNSKNGDSTVQFTCQNSSKLLIVVLSILHQPFDAVGDGTCCSVPQNACPYRIFEHTGEFVQFVAKYLTRDHPEYDVRVPQEAWDKTNMYCAFPACNSNPCQNGGSCKEELDGYSCSCLEAYRGKHCQIPTCYSNPCQNGGSCMEESDGYSCSCLKAYLGKNCQIPMCPADWEYAGTKCFLVTPSVVSYHAAKLHCNSMDAVTMGNGMMEDPALVFIESDEEFAILKTLVDNPWVWLNCIRISGSYICYSDRQITESDYRNWASNQPDNTRDCVPLRMTDGTMHDNRCTYQYTLVCQVTIREK
ncbi:neurocan core protein-like isoform X2 [Lytechinus variegatus]|uniref:neurocan core protein-like isoform X2 n=1 Tax=Lytechinus variegatus TaxID=7654 RepID=UPI001BB23A1A|nr:neurocan core protein-like isoform X2 [Lytechinus variegatus]